MNKAIASADTRHQVVNDLVIGLSILLQHGVVPYDFTANNIILAGPTGQHTLPPVPTFIDFGRADHHPNLAYTPYEHTPIQIRARQKQLLSIRPEAYNNVILPSFKRMV